MACVSHASFLKRTLSTRLSPRQPPLQPLARSNRRAGINQLNSAITQIVRSWPVVPSADAICTIACIIARHVQPCQLPAPMPLPVSRRLFTVKRANGCPPVAGVLTPCATLLSGLGAMTSPLSGMPRQGGYAPKLGMKRSLPRAILLYEGERKRERGLPRAILLYEGERGEERGKGNQRKEREKKFSKPKQTSVPPPLQA